MIAIARGIDRFDGRAAFSTWCYRVATNAALDELRRRRRRPVPAHPDGPQPVAPGPASRTAAARLDVDAALRRSRTTSGSRSCCATCATSTTRRSPRCSTCRPGRSARGSPAGAALLVERLDPQAERAPGAGHPAPGTVSPPPYVRTTMADDRPDDQRDERIATWLEPEPLDELTRRRLVTSAMQASADGAEPCCVPARLALDRDRGADRGRARGRARALHRAERQRGPTERRRKGAGAEPRPDPAGVAVHRDHAAAGRCR